MKVTDAKRQVLLPVAAGKMAAEPLKYFDENTLPHTAKCLSGRTSITLRFGPHHLNFPRVRSLSLSLWAVF